MSPPTRTVRRACLAALVANTVIVVTGGLVRLTASGLGCPTWPRCSDRSFVATREMGVHGAVEFGNRLLIYLLIAAVGAAIVTTMRERPRRPVLVRLSWVLFAGIFGQALLGGLTVLSGLAPTMVMAHFLLSMLLVAAATVLFERSNQPAGPRRPVLRPELVLGTRLLVGVVAVTLVLGTVVTGAGPHSGDRDATNRLPFPTDAATHLHADAVFLLVGLSIAMLLALRAVDAPSSVVRRTGLLLGAVLAQGTVGIVQYLTDLPVPLVTVHVLGACLVWIAAVRVALAAHVSVPDEPSTAQPAQPKISGSMATTRNSSVR